MAELDQIWSQMLGSAAETAGDEGRLHIAEYLRLKATNDAIRAAGVGWLFDSIIEIAGPAMAGQHGVTIDREDPHRFKRGSSNMAGSLLTLRQGVRCLSVEAGWARIPTDGIMQQGALAFARFLHFGMPKNDAEIRLVHAADLPNWLDAADTVIDTAWLARHFALFRG